MWPTLFNKMTYIPKINIMITDNKNLFFSMIALFILDLKISIIIMITKNKILAVNITIIL